MGQVAAEPRMRIDELARETGMTTRNIRAHQSRGLLPPPEVRARTGYYGPEHAARLHLIREMQAEGFNLRSIKRLLERGDHGEEALRFRRELLEPFLTEQPEHVTRAELEEVFGSPLDEKLVAKAEKLDALRPLGGGRWEVPSPTRLDAARELIEIGIPPNHVLAVAEAITRHTRAIAKEFVRLFVQDVLDPIRDRGGQVEEQDWAQAREALERLRPLAGEAVLAAFRQDMTAAIERQLERDLSR